MPANIEGQNYNDGQKLTSANCVPVTVLSSFLNVSVHLNLVAALRLVTIIVPIFTEKATEPESLAQTHRAKKGWPWCPDPGCLVAKYAGRTIAALLINPI